MTWSGEAGGGEAEMWTLLWGEIPAARGKSNAPPPRPLDRNAPKCSRSRRVLCRPVDGASALSLPSLNPFGAG